MSIAVRNKIDNKQRVISIEEWSSNQEKYILLTQSKPLFTTNDARKITRTKRSELK